jgi:hypothetical protein
LTQLLRGSTSITSTLVGEYYPSGSIGSQFLYSTHSVQYVDSPTTTSATTYKMQVNNVFSAPSMSANPWGNTMQIIAMEVLV